MKRTLVLLIASVFCLCISAQGQDRKRQDFNPADYKRHMQMFVSQIAQLTPEEGKAFFPLLDEMFGAQQEISNQQRDIMMKVNNPFDKREVSEEESRKAIDQLLALEVKNAQIEQAYYKKFQKILPSKKVIKVRHALYRYRMEALKNFRPQGGPPHNNFQGQKNK